MVELPDRWYCDTVPTTKFPVWSRGNAGEIWPGPISPLAGTSLFLSAGERGWRDAFELASLDADEWDPSPNNTMGSFGGYLYLNMSLSRIFGVRMPGMTPDMVDEQYFGDLSGIRRYADEARPTDESPGHTARLGEWVATEVFGVTVAPEVDDHRRAAEALVASRPSLATASEAEVVARLDSDPALYRDIFRRHILNSTAVGLGIGTVAGVCTAVGRPELAMTLIAAVGDVDSAAPAQAMWELSRLEPHSPAYRDGLSAFLARFGSRGPNEWELASPVWGTKPAIAEAAIDRMRRAGADAAPGAAGGRLAAAREAALAEVRALLAGADAETQGQFEAGVLAAQVYGAARERSKTTAILLVHEVRLAALELGRRLAADGFLAEPAHVFMLTRAELGTVRSGDAATWRQVAATRAEQYAALAELEPPFVVDGEPPPLSQFPTRAGRSATAAVTGDVLSGIPGCSGTATGRARVILDPADPSGLDPGDILVAPVTDPAWTPLFVGAGAVVVDVGAQITHAVIVSRELGIPCVVSVGDATNRIPDGAVVTVDGGAGTVTVLAPPGDA
jgi:pyruvate,water dikinase